jgi:hypothetical protein
VATTDFLHGWGIEGKNRCENNLIYNTLLSPTVISTELSWKVKDEEWLMYDVITRNNENQARKGRPPLFLACHFKAGFITRIFNYYLDKDSINTIISALVMYNI